MRKLPLAALALDEAGGMPGASALARTSRLALLSLLGACSVVAVASSSVGFKCNLLLLLAVGDLEIPKLARLIRKKMHTT